MAHNIKSTTDELLNYFHRQKNLKKLKAITASSPGQS